MRWPLLIWCAFGVAVMGLKLHLDRTALQYPDVAVRAGEETYYIPREMIEGTNGFRTDFQRLAGCWDAREAGLLPAAAAIAQCGTAKSMRLDIAAKVLGADAEIALRAKPLDVTFWPDYEPPGEHLPALVEAWARRGQWAGRKIVLRADWMVFRLETPNAPWVHLLTHEPTNGDEAELRRLYAGRCYRPEPTSDAGITCTMVLRVGGNAAVEYELGPDEMMSLVPIRDGLVAATANWRKPLLAANVN
jgi:hypothetical protein